MLMAGMGQKRTLGKVPRDSFGVSYLPFMNIPLTMPFGVLVQADVTRIGGSTFQSLQKCRNCMDSDINRKMGNDCS